MFATGASPPASLSCLPNEVLLHILILIPTKSLLALAGINQRFHSLVLRILHNRLIAAAALSGHSLLFECYHPSARLTEPHFICEYLGTPGLEDVCYNEAAAAPPGQWLGQLRNLYSRFLPHRRPIARKVQRRHPAGDVPGSRTHPDTTSQPASASGESQNQTSSNASSSGGSTNYNPSSQDTVDLATFELVTQHLHLDAGELFTQLTAATALFKPGPKSGLFLSFIEISRGTIRVWRNWLAEQSALQASNERSIQHTTNQEPEEEIQASTVPGRAEHTSGAPTEPPPAGDAKGKARSNRTPSSPLFQPLTKDTGILWDNSAKHNVGVRFRVRERAWRHAHRKGLHEPILAAVDDEDMAVSYEIVYEELVVRTSHLLLSVESSVDQLAESSGKAIVFGTWG